MVTPSTVLNLTVSNFPSSPFSWPRATGDSTIRTVRKARHGLAIPIANLRGRKVLPHSMIKPFAGQVKLTVDRVAELFVLAGEASGRLRDVGLRASPRPCDGDHFRPGHDDAGNGAVALLKLGEIKAQKR